MSATDQLKGAGFWYQTWLLFQKNVKTKRRQEFKKIFGEIALPVIYLAVLSLLVRTFNAETFPAQTDSYETPTNILNNTGDRNLTTPLVIHVAPTSNFTKNFTSTNLKSIWDRHDAEDRHNRTLEFVYHKTVEDLEAMYAQNPDGGGIKLALILPEEWTTVEPFAYKIRVNPDVGVPSPSGKTTDLSTCRDRNNVDGQLELPGTCPVNAYFYSNFLALQLLVEQAVLETRSGQEIKVEVTIENFPKDEYVEGMPTFMRVLIPLYSVIPLAQMVNVLLVLIVTEKEKKIKDGLRMVGISDGAYWLSWLGVYGIITTIFALAFTLIFHFLNVLHNADVLLLFLIFLLFGISVLVFAFALTPFFHKPRTAGIVGTLVIQFSSLMFLLQTFVEGTEAALAPLKLISSVAFSTALDSMAGLEYFGGVTWSDLHFGGRGEGVLLSLIFLIVDILLYGFVAFYLDNVMPNEFGVRKDPLFLFKPSYWIMSSAFVQNDGQVDNNRDDMHGNYEPVPESMLGKEAIQIRNIRKTYVTSFVKKTSVDALKGISLDIYDGQITAILGRNGAGKSTLFNILTGLMSPTSGSATVFGLDTRRPYDMARLRKMVGVCLQQDVLFPSLNAEEHLEFYGKLRGLHGEGLKAEVNKILHDFHLWDSRAVNADKLSGGQKRKLSVGIALMGDPKVILLDEPSAGLDPVSRRHLWTLLQQKKEGKVILLTTHFMDEADTLADRKAIIHDGTLKCLGSSLFLKNKYGVGYYLTVELADRLTDAAIADQIIEKWLPASRATRKIVSNEVKYSLPHTEAPKFPSIFADIEEVIGSGKSIKSYGVSMTTLEEVFLKISNDEAMTDDSGNSKTMNGANGQNYGSVTDGEIDLIQETGELNPKPLTTLKALLIFRLRRLFRSPQGVFFMIMMPIIFSAIGLYVAGISTKVSKYLKFDGPTSVYDQEDLHFAVNESGGTNLTEYLKQLGVAVADYDGDFASLLGVNPGKGSMAAMTFDSTNSSSMPKVAMRVNGTFLHSPPVVLHTLFDYLNREFGINNTAPVVLIYEPFQKKDVVLATQASLYSVFLLGPAVAFSCVGLVMEIVHDREIKARNHLRVNGVSFLVYFLSLFLTYGLMSLILIISQLALIGIFQVEALINPYAMTILTVMLILYIIPSQLFSAAFSYLFDRLETAQPVYSQVASWAGMLVVIVVIILDAVLPEKRWVVQLVHIIMSAVNVFYIPFGVFYWLIMVYLEATIYDSFLGKDTELSFGNYNRVEIIAPFICMLVQIPVFLALLLVADVLKSGGSPLDAIKNLFGLKASEKTHLQAAGTAENEIQTEDEDVAAERARIQKQFSGRETSEACVIAAMDLRKRYKQKGQFRQVLNGMNLMVDKGEVFGLLGHNGAGKTTTIRMLTAEEAPDSGRVSVCGYNVESNVSEAFRYLGFCAQQDALWENMTLQEHLELYARIRGVSPSNLNRVVEHFLKGLSIESHKDKHAEKLSGGTKRKLSYAIAMLGAPKIVLLDEPSTGMDPQSKRFLWNTILGTFKGDKLYSVAQIAWYFVSEALAVQSFALHNDKGSIIALKVDFCHGLESRGAILTTHSMEEADVLCSRIGIMVKGSLLCLGSSQHLKNKFGTGYTLEIKLRPKPVGFENDTVLPEERDGSMEQLLVESTQQPGGFSERKVRGDFSFVKNHFPSCRLVEAFGERAVFSIANDSVQSISRTFALLESLKATHNIEEYSFSQTTLEQVFLTFAKYNEDNEES